MSLLLGRIRSLSPYKGGALLPRRCCCSTVRLPPIDGRPLGFAPPPHSGFAFIAAPERQRLRTIVLTWSPPVYRLDVHTSEGRLASLYARKRFLRMNFGELRFGEVRRIPIPRTSVNKPPADVPEAARWHHVWCTPGRESRVGKDEEEAPVSAEEKNKALVRRY